jgi:DNA-directed RNA polymerase subunit RPC12/RpoP
LAEDKKIILEREEVPDACPHCGNKLSPWQQVLLATDRALVCKNCWYRIILDVMPTTKETDSDKSKNKDKK